MKIFTNTTKLIRIFLMGNTQNKHKIRPTTDKLVDRLGLNKQKFVLGMIDPQNDFLQGGTLAVDNANDIIGPINVNSGSTLPGEYVNIWRVEEFEKVLIHEIQHYYGCDFHSSDPNYYLIKNVIEKHFDIDGDDKVNESYNEALAHIIAMVYFSKIHKIQLQDVYHHELYFLIFQTAKIIEYFDGKKYELVFRSEKGHIIINQRTSVLSYYLIKTLFMFYINYTTKFINQISMQCNDKRSIEILSKFIEIIIQDRSIGKYITPLIRLIKKNKSDKFIYKTMRMTGIN